MLAINIPGGSAYQFTQLVLDYNGTLAEDGALIHGVAERLTALASQMIVQVITADTFGSAASALNGIPVRLKILGSGAHDVAKAAFVHELGAEQVVAIGNGRNDALMLRTAALGVAVMQAEGTAQITLAAADVVVKSINDALDLLLQPQRLIATLRN
ncbi:MAG: ATPase P [Halothiobacillus sp. 24-54-40]|nr:MAG: ATPase P [Halothiobacillus sp. 35-54-62]OYZ88446.1 MAG: ATPase P [Halothiobacillus sp. 24-54-40]OZA81754.1 MAG: ATPase P [Halothiobacillus sp. 39-53-45]HQS01786.1 HAD hydrolase family protein [Halothiobacillus sp.]HQS28362.1 HAD hydrolase family protein [Halothiobacillus sp.]